MKPKRCPMCKQMFEPFKPLQKCCGWECAHNYAVKKRLAEANAAAKADRKTVRLRKEALKTRSDWIKDAQAAVNAYVRARDADKTCICCGKPFEPNKPGGSMDAGHYLSRGTAPHLRFDADRNIFGQRKNCNRPGGATREAFRAGVIARIGPDAVEALEADQTPRKWTIEELKAIRDTYRQKLKELKGADRG